jgi:hypothetical protein
MKSFELSLSSPQEVSRRRGRRLQLDEGERGGECFKLVPRQGLSVGGTQNCPSIRVLRPKLADQAYVNPTLCLIRWVEQASNPPSWAPEIQVHKGGSHRLPTSLVCLNLATDAIRSLGRDEVLGPRTQRYSDPDA